MSKHIHLHLHDAGTPEGARKAAQTRKAHAPLHKTEGNPYPKSPALHQGIAQYHEEQGAKHYQNATFQQQHLQARKKHLAAAKAITSRAPNAGELSSRAHAFSRINRL